MTDETSKTDSLTTADRILEAHAGSRLQLIASSYFRLTGRSLLPASGASTSAVSASDGNLAEALWSAPYAILAHGTEDDPLFFYANRQALTLFELTPQQLMTMPSRFSAEPVKREERAALLARVTQNGFIDDYSGIRISSSGKRFRIQQATVWNLLDEEGVNHGQAATFAHWEFI